MINIYSDRPPFVSVIMATMNRSGLISRAINSLLKQSFKQWELIIADDGSQDDTFAKVSRYIAKYANIRYLKHSRRGLALTRNAGIMASAGRFITFLDSDDRYAPIHLEERFNFMTDNPAIDLIHGGVKIIGDPFVKDKRDLTQLIHLNDCVIGATFFGKREVFLSLGGFRNMEYSEDSEFMERAEKKFRVKKVFFPSYIYYRDTADSICNNVEA